MIVKSLRKDILLVKNIPVFDSKQIFPDLFYLNQNGLFMRNRDFFYDITFYQYEMSYDLERKSQVFVAIS